MTSKPSLERVREVTDNFFFWQGLRWIPAGLVLVVAGLSWTEGWPLNDAASTALLLAVLAVGAFASSAIGRHYQRTFGQVRGIPGHHRRRTATKWALVYPAMAGSLVVDAVLEPRVFISGFVWGAAIAAYWWSTGRGRPHYVIAVALLFTFAILPTVGTIAVGRPILSLFFVVVGGIYMVGGLLDHLALRRVLPPIPADGGPV
jgi:hypothetical protein